MVAHTGEVETMVGRSIIAPFFWWVLFSQRTTAMVAGSWNRVFQDRLSTIQPFKKSDDLHMW